MESEKQGQPIWLEYIQKDPIFCGGHQSRDCGGVTRAFIDCALQRDNHWQVHDVREWLRVRSVDYCTTIEDRRFRMKLRMSQAIAVTIAVVCAMAFSPIAQAQSTDAGPTDPQIVGIVETANSIDIDYAKLALSKSQNKEVRGFAEQMVTDHSTLQKSVRDLAAKLNVKPADSGTSQSLKSQSEETTAKLKALAGEAFDKAYIDNEIAFHKEVINATNSVLILNANNAELKSALQGAVPLFQGHLEHAQSIAASLTKA
jgi:putative membrane protein